MEGEPSKDTVEMRKLVHTSSPSVNIDIHDQPQPELETVSSRSDSDDDSDDDESNLIDDNEADMALSEETYPPTCLFVVVVASGVGLGRFVALLIAYPGHLRVVTRDCERNYAKMCQRWLLLTADTTDDLINLLQSPEPWDQARVAAFVAIRDDYRSCVTNIMAILSRSLEIVDAEDTLTPDGRAVLSRARLYLQYANDLEPALLLAISREAGAAAPSFHAAPLAVGLRAKRANSTRTGLARLVSELWQSRRPFEIVANLSLMRADLAARYVRRPISIHDVILKIQNGRQLWVDAPDGHRIDAMFLPGHGQSNASSNNGRTVLLCNPNCGLYEFHHFQSDWIPFYTNHGINVCVFNYRGYGRCQGYPSPHANNVDGMAMVRHLQVVQGVTRLAVHGESIGGMVATYVAKHAAGIELLVADRTFANLPAVAQRLVGTSSSCLSLLCVRVQLAKQSRHSVVGWQGFDVRHSIVSDASSLKAGIALRLELGDMKLDARGHTSCLAPPCGSLQARHDSTALVSSNPLNEYSVEEFALALERIAQRAREAMSPSSRSDSDEKRIVDVWSAVASVDGHCGQSLFYASGGGLETIRTWMASLLVWGPSRAQSQADHPETAPERRRDDFVTPISLDQAHAVLCKILDDCPSFHEDADVTTLVAMVEYLQESMALRLAQTTPSHDIGRLVPLNCGHNANFSDREKQAFATHLISFNWLDADTLTK
ncbi:hypothetical protein DYB30_003723 [Aphanomyces astaci]|uniref:AB hydrolase-1 domain-containing protein n=2 Tax=Aphanomyces astaci TaxID=112090 RepID=A0A397DLL6_APHAT|nr:hypothetical protein DYB30_003723 [Aphanomyces astaci]